VQNSLCIQVLHSPILAASLQRASAKLCGVEKRAPPVSVSRFNSKSYVDFHELSGIKRLFTRKHRLKFGHDLEIIMDASQSDVSPSCNCWALCRIRSLCTSVAVLVPQSIIQC